MLRNFGISLLLFGLLAAGIDGFRVRETATAQAPSDGSATELDDNGVHSAEAGIFPPN